MMEYLDLGPLDHGIRRTVAWLRSLGFETTDSGDGVTKRVAILEGEALDRPHVFIRVDAPDLLVRTVVLHNLLTQRGLAVPPGMIQATYDPADGSAILMLMDVNDALIAEHGIR